MKVTASVVSPIRRSREAGAEGRAAEAISQIAALSVRLHASLVRAGLLPALTGFDLWKRREPHVERGNQLLADGKADEALKEYDQAVASRIERTPTLLMTRKGKVTPWSSWNDYGLFKSMVDLLLSK